VVYMGGWRVRVDCVGRERKMGRRWWQYATVSGGVQYASAMQEVAGCRLQEKEKRKMMGR